MHIKEGIPECFKNKQINLTEKTKQDFNTFLFWLLFNIFLLLCLPYNIILVTHFLVSFVLYCT
jgi:hypothetical protein